MKGTRHRSFLGALLLLFVSSSAQALPPFSPYGPACQWIRLFGEWQRPPGLDPKEPIFLTVTYRLPGQQAPATLLTNRPILGEKFTFVLSGFRETIDGTLFVRPGFFFAKKIEFDYYATAAGRKWKSAWKRSVYRPERVQRDGNTYCRTAIPLEPVEWEAP